MALLYAMLKRGTWQGDLDLLYSAISVLILRSIILSSGFVVCPHAAVTIGRHPRGRRLVASLSTALLFSPRQSSWSYSEIMDDRYVHDRSIPSAFTLAHNA